MQDLSGSYPLSLAPSSMSGGNTLADDPHLTMTAPGSQSVNPLPDRKDILPMPQIPGSRIPVSNAPNKPAAQGSDTGGGSFTHAAFGGTWKGTPANG